jgi:hypothetical protein
MAGSFHPQQEVNLLNFGAYVTARRNEHAFNEKDSVGGCQFSIYLDEVNEGLVTLTNKRQ